jgi:CDP-glucose 4,6-dehydratase
VIGGGDWAADRIVPDCVRALTAGEPIVVRNPDAVRPWQHVLESLSGYLLLAERLWEDDGEAFAEGWNFGPVAAGGVPVRELVEGLIASWGSGSWKTLGPVEQPHEANLLRLDCTKAQTRLGWQPQWDVATTLERTARWYAAWHADGFLAASACMDDLSDYVDTARTAGSVWA